MRTESSKKRNYSAQPLIDQFNLLTTDKPMQEYISVTSETTATETTATTPKPAAEPAAEPAPKPPTAATEPVTTATTTEPVTTATTETTATTPKSTTTETTDTKPTATETKLTLTTDSKISAPAEEDEGDIAKEIDTHEKTIKNIGDFLCTKINAALEEKQETKKSKISENKQKTHLKTIEYWLILASKYNLELSNDTVKKFQTLFDEKKPENPSENIKIFNFFSVYLKNTIEKKLEKSKEIFYDTLEKIIKNTTITSGFADEFLFSLIKPRFNADLNSHVGNGTPPLLWTMNQFMEKTDHALAYKNIELITLLSKKKINREEDFLDCISMACALDDAHQNNCSHNDGKQNQILKTIIDNYPQKSETESETESEKKYFISFMTDSILCKIKIPKDTNHSFYKTIKNIKEHLEEELASKIEFYINNKNDDSLKNIKKLHKIAIAISQENYELSRQLASEYFVDSQREWLKNSMNFAPYIFMLLNVFFVFCPFIPAVNTVMSASVSSAVVISIISALPWITKLDQYLEKENSYTKNDTLPGKLRKISDKGFFENISNFFNFSEKKDQEFNWEDSIGNLKNENSLLHPMVEIRNPKFNNITKKEEEKFKFIVLNNKKNEFIDKIKTLEKEPEKYSKDTFNLMKFIRNITLDEKEEKTSLEKISLRKHDFMYEIVKQKIKSQKNHQLIGTKETEPPPQQTRILDTLNSITPSQKETQRTDLRLLAVMVQSAGQCLKEVRDKKIKKNIQTDLGQAFSKSANVYSKVVSPYGNIEAFSVIFCILTDELYRLHNNESARNKKTLIKTTLMELMVSPLQETINNTPDGTPKKTILQNNLALIQNRLFVRLEEFLVRKETKTNCHQLFFDDCADLKGIMRYLNTLIGTSREKPIASWRASAEPQDQGILPLAFSLTPIVLSGVGAALSTHFVNQYLNLNFTTITMIALLCMVVPTIMNKLGSEQSRANRFLPAPVKEAQALQCHRSATP